MRKSTKVLLYAGSLAVNTAALLITLLARDYLFAGLSIVFIGIAIAGISVLTEGLDKEDKEEDDALS